MIKANIETEIAPIVGTEQQAKDLIAYIGESDVKRREHLGDQYFRKIYRTAGAGRYPKQAGLHQRGKPGKAPGYHAENRQRQQRRAGVHYYMTRTRAAKKAACSFGQLPFCADRLHGKNTYSRPCSFFQRARNSSCSWSESCWEYGSFPAARQQKSIKTCNAKNKMISNIIQSLLFAPESSICK